MKTTFDGMEMDFEDDLLNRRPEGDFDPLHTPYAVREQDFPRAGSFEDQLRFLLQYAILAPSTHNTQPWRFALLPAEGVAVYADYTRRLPVVDTANRELLMSIGAALYNLRVAAAHFNMRCEVSYNVSGDSERPIAMVRLTPPGVTLSEREARAEGPGAPAAAHALFPYLTTRHTNRNPFLLSRISASVMQRLAATARGCRCQLVVSTDGKVNERIADMVAQAEQKQWTDVGFREDLAEWIRPAATPDADGVPGAAYGWTGAVATLGQYAARTIDQGRLRAARDRNLCIEAPGLVILTSEDAVPDLLEAGETMEALLLTVMHEGLQYSYFNMPVQVPEFRTELKALLGCSLWPQLILRVGYCLTPPAPTPRKQLQEVMLPNF